MITGLEPVAAKFAATGALRAMTFGGAQVMRGRRQRAAAQLLEDWPVHDGETLATQQLDAQQQEAFAAFVRSAEYSQFCLALATHKMLPKCGRGADARVAETESQLATSLWLATGIEGDLLESLATELVSLANRAIDDVRADFFGDADKMPAELQAGLVMSAAGLATSTARNTELLSRLDSIATFKDFAAELNAQVRSLHGTMRLPHAGTTRQVPYERLFVQPTVLTGSSAASRDGHATESLEAFVGLSMRTVLRGDPGGGKSTTSLKLAYDLAADRLPEMTQRSPFLVVLRDYAEQFASSRLSMMDYLDSLCRAPYGIDPPEGAIEYLLLNGRAFVIFDGLDELLDTSLRTEVVQVVEGFAHRFPLTQILVTSRRVGYDEAPLAEELFTLAELQQFSDDQVEAYARKWFALDDSIAIPQRDSLVESFLSDSEFVDDLRVNPLMLSLMCGIYASERYIPRNRPDVYEKCALLLFERWDKQRGINAPLPFDAHVQSALRALALWLYPKQESQLGLPRSKLIQFMTDYLRHKRFDTDEDAEQAATEFIDFCTGRAWVLTDVGAELYGFTHRTFLEYFAATQIVRENASSDALLDVLRPHILLAEWDVVAQLAVQILGKTVEDGADDFLDGLLDLAAPLDTSREKRNALDFAARALHFIVPRPPVIRRIVDACVDDHCQEERTGSLRAETPMASIVAGSNENMALIGRYLNDKIADRLKVDPGDEQVLALAFYLPTQRIRNGPFDRVDTRAYEIWATLNRRFRDDFAVQLDYQATFAVWAGVTAVREGRLDVPKFVERFGVEALFRDTELQDFFLTSLVSSLIDNVRRNRRNSTMPTGFVAGVYDVLSRSAGPWVVESENARRQFPRLPDLTFENPIENQLLRSTITLCILPYLEIEVNGGGSSRRRAKWKPIDRRSHLHSVLTPTFRTDGPRRSDTGKPAAATAAETQADVLAALDLLPAAARIVRDWMSGRRDFTLG